MMCSRRNMVGSKINVATLIEVFVLGFSLLEELVCQKHNGDNKSKRYKYLYNLNVGFDVNNNGYETGNGHKVRTWHKLHYLSLWIAVGGYRLL